MYPPSHRQTSTPVITIQSTLRTAPHLYKNVPLAELFGSNGNSYTVCTKSDICIYIYIYSSQYSDAGRAKEIAKKKKTGIEMNTACQGNLSACHFRNSSRRFVNPGLGYKMDDREIVVRLPVARGSEELCGLPASYSTDTEGHTYLVRGKTAEG
jgi:hypothetical protein